MQAKQQLFARLNGGKRSRVQQVAAESREELKQAKEKEVFIDRGKVIKVNRAAYSKEQTEAVFHCLAHIVAIRDAQFKLKGTEFYSASLEREMDKISSTKLMPIFKQNPPGYIADTTMAMAEVFSQMCDFSFQLSLQPEKVQERFEKEYKNLLISCGITISK
ncbi:hypothetical protein [Dyadobacter sp. CY312]|uniref:hypothetical protein n=1 Tax=Dyadobacter sp. CY312 TaxID=2907303 RepID=UPI001F3F7E52|nr:hypothetical protein [Dyadobacter sp. CY312]MCE7039272.1 hypothetical protein [Dyadobacter sp. CY312]